jgi:hypothetical protein
LGDPAAAPGGQSLAVKIDSEKGHPLAWKTVAKRAAVVLVAGLTIYLVFPAITEVLASWPRLSTLDPRWFTLAIGAEIAHFICTFALQRLARLLLGAAVCRADRVRRLLDPVQKPPVSAANGGGRDVIAVTRARRKRSRS